MSKRDWSSDVCSSVFCTYFCGCATLWQQPQKYVQHSAVMFADRITTPLLLLTGAQDSNVPADNTREMYYALRRLGKEVVWVNYMNGGHGAGNATVEDFLDFHKRIV